MSSSGSPVSRGVEREEERGEVAEGLLDRAVGRQGVVDRDGAGRVAGPQLDRRFCSRARADAVAAS